MNLKKLVNDKPLWDNFLEYLEGQIKQNHRSLEQASDNITVFRTQGAITVLRRLKLLKEPDSQKPKYPKINYQDLYYYSAPKSFKEKPKSLEDLDPKLLETYKKLGIPLQEQKRLNNIAVDAVFDSVSVATTFKEKLTEKGIIFCSIGEAVQKHPEIVKNILDLLYHLLIIILQL